MNKILLTIMLLTVTLGAFASDLSMRGENAWSPKKLTVTADPPLLDALRESSGGPSYSIEAATVSAPDKLEAIRTWNQSNTPLKIGFSHSFATPAQVEINLSSGSLEANNSNKGNSPIGQLMETTNGDVMWSTTIEVDNSYRLRLHLDNINLPAGAKLWVSSNGDEVVGPFDMQLASPGGDLWTPSVAGPEIRLLVLLPESHPFASFSIDKVSETFRLNKSNEPITGPEDGDLSCLQQSLCTGLDTFAPIAEVERAIGRMEWMIPGTTDQVGLCTGGLINDTDGSTTIPYFLTANHCYNNEDNTVTLAEFQQLASTLEVYWDYAPDGCDGTKPDLGTLERSSGATVKATGVPADFLLLELSAIPANRYFLGFDLSDEVIAPGSTLHRVHHPGGDVQSYSQTTVMAGAQACGEDWTTETHIWHSSVIGGTVGGSSGSPVLTPAGQIVGQLSGSCGDFPQCSAEEPTIDGKLSNYWAEVAPFLAPGTTTDLALTALDSATGEYEPGASLYVSADVANLGSVASPAYTITIYLSTDTTITTSDIEVTSQDLDPLAAGGTTRNDGDLVLPANTPPGTYYFGAILTPTDSNPANNVISTSVPITVTGSTASHDLSLQSLSAADGTYAPGASLSVTAAVANLGVAASPAYRITLYASTDTNITSSDILLVFEDLDPMGAGTSFTNDGDFPLPANIPNGNYYIGGIITPTDGVPSNNIAFDPTPITITGGTTPSFNVNMGLNGAWYNPTMDGQGILLEVLPAQKLAFVAWFTWDTTRPSGSDTSQIGEFGQRWLTALGSYSSNQMVLPIYRASGGIFASGSQPVSQVAQGTMTLTFISCTEATLVYSGIPGVPDGVINLVRLANDNVAQCQSMSQ